MVESVRSDGEFLRPQKREGRCCVVFVFATVKCALCATVTKHRDAWQIGAERWWKVK